MYTGNEIRDCHGKSSIQQEEEEGSFHQQIGLKFKEGTGKAIHSEHSFARCGNLDTSKKLIRSIIKFVKCGAGGWRIDPLNRSCEK